MTSTPQYCDLTGVTAQVIKLTSPGGAVADYGLASSQMLRLKRAGIATTVCVDTVAASGGCVTRQVLSLAVADHSVLCCQLYDGLCCGQADRCAIFVPWQHWSCRWDAQCAPCASKERGDRAQNIISMQLAHSFRSNACSCVSYIVSDV